MVSRNKGEQVKKCLIVFCCSRVVQKANAKAVSALMSSKRVLTKMKTSSVSFKVPTHHYWSKQFAMIFLTLRPQDAFTVQV